MLLWDKSTSSSNGNIEYITFPSNLHSPSKNGGLKGSQNTTGNKHLRRFLCFKLCVLHLIKPSISSDSTTPSFQHWRRSVCPIPARPTHQCPVGSLANRSDWRSHRICWYTQKSMPAASLHLMTALVELLSISHLGMDRHIRTNVKGNKSTGSFHF